jgi:hypothetical protein
MPYPNFLKTYDMRDDQDIRGVKKSCKSCPLWCDSFTYIDPDQASFQTWLFEYGVLVIGLGQG